MDLTAGRDPPFRRRRRHPGGGVALLAVIVVGGLAVARWSRDDSVAAVPSPLFDEVEQLTPTSLPEGWARCAAGPSGRAEATGRWWAQAFGPMADGECTPLVTVIQIPPKDDVRW